MLADYGLRPLIRDSTAGWNYHIPFKCIFPVLAGGIAIQEDFFVVEVPFDDRIVRTYATFAPGDGILIGTAMLENYRLTIDFPAESLMLERED